MSHYANDRTLETRFARAKGALAEHQQASRKLHQELARLYREQRSWYETHHNLDAGVRNRGIAYTLKMITYHDKECGQ